jgi:hypothetical protein
MFKRSNLCAVTRKPDHVTTSPIGRPSHNLPKHIQRDEATEKDLVRAYFGHKCDGVYVEVGANDPTSPESQSHHLATKLGWTGLLVEPIHYLAQLARDERPAAVVCECACTVPEKVGKLELLIDVEGAELDVLLGADLGRLQPQVILLEDKHLYLFKHRFLVKSGYELAQRHNRNCWYIRKGQALPTVGFAQKFKLWKRMYISIWVKKIAYAIRHRTWKPFLTL